MNACTKKHCQDALEVKVNKKERTFIQFHKHRIKVLSRQYFDSSCLNYLKFKESVIIFQYILLKLNSVKEIDLISWTQQRTPNFVSYLTKILKDFQNCLLGSRDQDNYVICTSKTDLVKNELGN